MGNWLSIAELSENLDISETRIHEYLNNFEEYFRWEEIEEEKKYDPDSIKILQRIVMLDKTDFKTIEIKEILAKEFVYQDNDSEDEVTINRLVCGATDDLADIEGTIEPSFKVTFFSTIVFVGGGILFFWVLLFLFFTSRLLGG